MSMDEFVGMDLGTEDDDALTTAIWLQMTMIEVSQGAERRGWGALVGENEQTFFAI